MTNKFKEEYKVTVQYYESLIDKLMKQRNASKEDMLNEEYLPYNL